MRRGEFYIASSLMLAGILGPYVYAEKQEEKTLESARTAARESFVQLAAKLDLSSTCDDVGLANCIKVEGYHISKNSAITKVFKMEEGGTLRMVASIVDGKMSDEPTGLNRYPIDKLASEVLKINIKSSARDPA
jgi:hypothetical protein